MNCRIDCIRFMTFQSSHAFLLECVRKVVERKDLTSCVFVAQCFIKSACIVFLYVYSGVLKDARNHRILHLLTSPRLRWNFWHPHGRDRYFWLFTVNTKCNGWIRRTSTVFSWRILRAHAESPLSLSNFYSPRKQLAFLLYRKLLYWSGKAGRIMKARKSEGYKFLPN